MIRFFCRCGRPLEVDNDQAGLDAQCPSCGTLVSVPTLSDVESIEGDGTYKIDLAKAEHDERARLTELRRVFTRNRVDEETGEEIDLRATYADLADAGYYEGPQPEVAPVYAKPRYDPITGELIRPIEVKEDEANPPVNPATIPMARANVSYRTAGAARHGGPAPVPVMLFAPVNIVVMSVLFVIHVICQLIVFVAFGAGILFLAPAMLIVFCGMLAHFVNTIDETGPRELDELPRPGRDLGLGEDLFMPFWQLVMSLVISYSPLILIAITAPKLPAFTIAPIALLAVAVGTFYFPACILTAATSGVANNLRPDRVLSVIFAAGPKYLLYVVLWAAAAVAYAAGLWGTLLMPMGMLWQNMPWWTRSYVAYPLLITGIYLVHWFAWSLGLLYRRHHAEFTWVLQRHKRKDQEKSKGFAVMRPQSADELPVLEALPNPLPPRAGGGR